MVALGFLSDAVLAWYIPHRLGAGWLAILACAGTALLTDWFHLAVHEFGHMLAAFVVRIPVADVDIAAGRSTRVRNWAGIRVRLGLGGSRSRVAFADVYGRPVLAPRMAAISLAGPAANLVVAVAAAGAAVATTATIGRAAWFMVAGMALIRGTVNLLPIPRADGQRFDGWQVLNWLLRPNRAAEQLRCAEVLRTAARAVEAGRPVDRAALTALVAHAEPTFAAAAALTLLKTADPDQLTDLLADRARLGWLATASRVPRRIRFALKTAMIDGLVDKIGRDHSRRLPTRSTAASAAHLVQSDRWWRQPVTLAYLRLRQGRPRDARHLLDEADRTPVRPALRASALAVRAMVEHALGNEGEARQLVVQAKGLDPDARWLAEARNEVTEPASG
jgi:Zn-dependent protease